MPGRDNSPLRLVTPLATGSAYTETSTPARSGSVFIWPPFSLASTKAEMEMPAVVLEEPSGIFMSWLISILGVDAFSLLEGRNWLFSPMAAATWPWGRRTVRRYTPLSTFVKRYSPEVFVLAVKVKPSRRSSVTARSASGVPPPLLICCRVPRPVRARAAAGRPQKSAASIRDNKAFFIDVPPI